jgi:SHS2 domain-containing protein
MYTRLTSKYREIDHTADIGLVGEGSTLPALFASLAFGMIQIACHASNPEARQDLTITLDDTAADGLLVQWLSEINYQLIVNHFLLVSIPKLSIHQSNIAFHLTAHLSGADIGSQSDLLKTEIKAVTYHQLSIEKKNDTYKARVIFDI